MSSLRRMSLSRLIALATAFSAVIAVCATIVGGALAGDPSTPPPKPLASALHDAVTAPPVEGVTAKIAFTNHLVGSSSIEGGGPLLSGASGRLWATPDGRVRLELQSDRGDTQVISDGKSLQLYDGASDTVYDVALPQGHSGDSATAPPRGARGAPTVARIQEGLTRLAGDLDLSGATPSVVAGHEAYTVRLSPKRDGGLIGAAQVAWDAATGVPLRAAVYASGNDTPVLELTATEVAFGPVDPANLRAAVHAGAKRVPVDLASPRGGRDARADRPHGGRREVTGRAAVARQLPFTLAAPATLAGKPRTDVHLVGGRGDHASALVTYGQGLGGVTVLEQRAEPGTAHAPADHGGQAAPGLSLPTVDVNGTAGQELATPLGTLIRFQRGGVQYTIAGSVPQAVAEDAARGL